MTQIRAIRHLNKKFIDFRDVALTVLSVVSLFLSVLWVSVFLYGSFYFLYMPSQTYEMGLNFKFDPCSGEEPIGVKCSFLEANVSFLSPENPSPYFGLLPGQSYMVITNVKSKGNR